MTIFNLPYEFRARTFSMPCSLEETKRLIHDQVNPRGEQPFQLLSSEPKLHPPLTETIYLESADNDRYVICAGNRTRVIWRMRLILQRGFLVEGVFGAIEVNEPLVWCRFITAMNDALKAATVSGAGRSDVGRSLVPWLLRVSKSRRSVQLAERCRSSNSLSDELPANCAGHRPFLYQCRGHGHQPGAGADWRCSPSRPGPPDSPRSESSTWNPESASTRVSISGSRWWIRRTQCYSRQIDISSRTRGTGTDHALKASTARAANPRSYPRYLTKWQQCGLPPRWRPRTSGVTAPAHSPDRPP